MTANAPQWAITMRALREARGWSQSEVVDRMRRQATEPLPEDDSLIRRWKAWEAGRNRPSDFYAPLIAAALGTVTAALFPPDPNTSRGPVMAGSGLDSLDIISRLQHSDVNDSTLESLRITVETLCSEYARRPGVELITEARHWLRRIADLRGRSLSLRHHRDAMEMAGWLALLLGCIEYDLGNDRQAETTRRSALSLGVEVGSGPIIAWAHEMRAWFALTTGDYRGVLAAASAGLAAAPHDSVAVQLLAQEAKAFARLGSFVDMERSLEAGRQQLDSLPYPENTDNHFVVDPSKFDFYAMDCYRHIGNVPLSRTLAEGVLRSGTGFGGEDRSPMRNAEAHITLAVASVADGDVDEALREGRQAIRAGRQSIPSLTMVISDLVHVLDLHHADDAHVRDFKAEVRALQRQA